jgi:hypothetical protein
MAASFAFSAQSNVTSTAPDKQPQIFYAGTTATFLGFSPDGASLPFGSMSPHSAKTDNHRSSPPAPAGHRMGSARWRPSFRNNVSISGQNDNRRIFTGTGPASWDSPGWRSFAFRRNVAVYSARTDNHQIFTGTGPAALGTARMIFASHRSNV